MTVLPLFHSCKEQYGELCCCTTCCDFEAGALLCSYSHFVFSLGFYVDTSYVLFLILSFICIYSIYKYIYILHIFLYLCLLLSWEWCDYVIKSNYVIADLFFFLQKLYSHLQWENYSHNLNLFCEYLNAMNSSSQHMQYLSNPQIRQWLGLHTGCSECLKKKKKPKQILTASLHCWSV